MNDPNPSQDVCDSAHSAMSELQFKPESDKTIYEALAQHQQSEESGDLRQCLEWMHLWSGRFIGDFQLEVPAVSLCLDWLDPRCYGHFRRGINGFGLTGEIAINRRYLDCRDPWEILGTLFHELLHAWQELHGAPGKNNYHNQEFRSKAREFGLIIDSRGYTRYEPVSPFFSLLEEYGVSTPELPPVRTTQRGQSKLKKWSCQCLPRINVRVAVPNFNARCLWCGAVFTLAE